MMFTQSSLVSCHSKNELIQDKRAMYCSSCNIEWSKRNRYCQQCGRPLQPSQTVTSTKTSNLLVCARCHTKASRDDVQCKQCGNPLGNTNTTTQQTIDRQPQRASRSTTTPPNIEAELPNPRATGNPIIGRFLMKLSHPFVLGCFIFSIITVSLFCVFFAYFMYWMEYISSYQWLFAMQMITLQRNKRTFL